MEEYFTSEENKNNAILLEILTYGKEADLNFTKRLLTLTDALIEYHKGVDKLNNFTKNYTKTNL